MEHAMNILYRLGGNPFLAETIIKMPDGMCVQQIKPRGAKFRTEMVFDDTPV